LQKAQSCRVSLFLGFFSIYLYIICFWLFFVMDAGSMNTSSSLKAQSRFPLQQQFLPRTNSKENVRF
jgi:cyanate permease